MTDATDTSLGGLAALARYSDSLGRRAIPEDVRREARYCILDTLGCIVAGAASPEGAQALAAERLGIGQTPRDTLLPEAEARLLGYWGDVFELNDLIGGHASVGNVAAALAVARHRRSTGDELLRAAVAGIEVTSRVSEAHCRSKKPYPDCGIVAVSIQSSIGAAAAAGLLCKLDPGQLQQALAIAGTLSSWGPAEVIFGNGGTIKPVLFGACPADAAVRAVAYARQGLTGPPHLLDSRIGLFATIAHAYDDDVLRDQTHWHLLAPQRKLHACCGFTHSSIDVVADMRRRGFDFSRLSRLDIDVPAYIIPAVSKTAPPTTQNEARFHLQYCVALAACGADTILPAHSLDFAAHIARDDVRQVMERISIRPMELPAGAGGNLYNHCRVRAVPTQGDAMEDASSTPRGSLGNPLSGEALVRKFHALTEPHLSAGQRDECVERLLTLEEQASCEWLFGVLDDLPGLARATARAEPRAAIR